MDIEDVKNAGIVIGVLIGLLTLTGLTYRQVIQPVWRTIRRLNEVADVLLGDKAKQLPSLPERLDALETQLREHQEWHTERTRGNGPRPATTERRRTT